MNTRRSFLKDIAGWVSAISFVPLLFGAKQPTKFYWVDEESEIYAARDFEQLCEMHNDHWRDKRELLTPDNEGQFWGEVCGVGIVTCHETGEAWTYSQALKEWGWKMPCQIATSYT